MNENTCPGCGKVDLANYPFCPECGYGISESTIDKPGSHTASLDPPHFPMLDEDSPIAMPGQNLGNFEIIELIGKGGFGEVYRARDNKLGREVAIKFLPREYSLDMERRHRFLREAKAASALNHPNICTIFELGETGGQFYMVMELLKGESLRERIRDCQLTKHEILHFAKQIAEGLLEAHRKNIIHRDIKSGNIQVTPRNQIKILDFGLAKRTMSNSNPEGPPLPSVTLTTEGQAMGTLHYMAPEQVMGEQVDKRSDLFSFGVVLYEMITGKLPFSKNSFYATMNAIVHNSPDPIRPPTNAAANGLVAIVEKMLSKKPEDRYQDAAEVLTALNALESPAVVAVQPRKLLFAALAAIPLVALLVWWAARQPASPLTHVKLALLTFDYQGPASEDFLADTFPIMLYESLRRSPRLALASFSISKEFQITEGVDSVASALNVDWIISGGVSISGTQVVTKLNLFKKGSPQEKPFKSAIRQGHIDTVNQVIHELVAGILDDLEISSDLALMSGSNLSTPAMEYYTKGKQNLEDWDMEGNVKKAAESFRQAIEETPTFAQAYAWLALATIQLYWETNEPRLYDQAKKYLEKANQYGPTLPETLLAMGIFNLASGKSAEAINDFKLALDQAPANDQVYYWIGRFYMKRSRWKEAEDYTLKAIELRPDYFGYHNQIGSVYFRQGKNVEAQAPFKKVIELRKNSDTGYTNLAAVYMAEGNFTEAEPLLHAAISILPSAQAYSNLGSVYYGMQRYQEAAEQYKLAIGLQPESADYHCNLGEVCRILNQRDESIAEYQKSIDILTKKLEIDPANNTVLAQYGISLAGIHDCEGAREVFLSIDPWDAISHLLAAMGYAFCGMEDETKFHAAEASKRGLKKQIEMTLEIIPYLDK